MSAIIFPTSPAINDIFSSGGRSWIWTGSVWNVYSSLAAANVGNVPAGNIAATDVQAALNELDTEKAALAGGTYTGNLTLNGTANTAPNQTAASDSSIMTRSLGDTRFLSRDPSDGDVARLAFRLAAFPELKFGTTYQLANNGTWTNWGGVTTYSWAQLQKQQTAASSAGWSRAGIYNFLLNTGESSTCIAGRGFTFTCRVNLPSDTAAIAMATDFYFGAQLTETGGALTARGLRVRIEGNTPTSSYKVTAAIHNGSSETTGTANISANSIIAALVIRWLPSGTTPSTGSKLEVWGRNQSSGDNVLTLLTSATLSGSLGATNFAGSAFAVVASSAGTTPGYTANWEIGGIASYVH